MATGVGRLSPLAYIMRTRVVNEYLPLLRGGGQRYNGDEEEISATIRKVAGVKKNVTPRRPFLDFIGLPLPVSLKIRNNN